MRSGETISEIAEDYAAALELWATATLGRAPSLERVYAELPRQIRPNPRAARAAPPAADAPPPAADAPPPAAAEPDEAAAALRVEVPPSSPLLKHGAFGRAAIRRASPAARMPPAR